MQSEDIKTALREADRRISEHPGYQVHQDLTAFARSIRDVFRANLHELLALLEKAATDWMLAFELVQNSHDDAERERFHAVTTQRLHNYLASTMSLTEHARRLLRDREGPIVEAHEARKAEILTHGEVPFMWDLRRFIQHRTLPPLAHSLSMDNVNTPEASMTSEVELSVWALLKWDGWTVASRRFLSEHDEVVVIRPVVRLHAGLVFQLNSLLHHALAEDNQPALDEVNRLGIERNAILMAATVEQAEAHMRSFDEQRKASPGFGPLDF
jgi:hypothetical protein